MAVGWLEPVGHHQCLCHTVADAGQFGTIDKPHSQNCRNKGEKHQFEQLRIVLPHENVWRRHLCGALFVFSHQSESTYKQKRIDATVAQKGAELDKNALPRMKQEMEERVGAFLFKVKFVAVVSSGTEAVRQVVGDDEQNAHTLECRPLASGEDIHFLMYGSSWH